MKPASSTASHTQPVPVAFVAHGAPFLALDPDKGSELQRWASQLPKPRAILAISAHWTRAPISVGALRRPDLIYDFYGFPDPLYQLTYSAPGAPWLGERLAGLIGTPLAHTERGMDHGVWIPLLWMWPDADVPVVQISMPADMPAAELLALGAALAPLRQEGVLILASGNLVHNLQTIKRPDGHPAPDWARQFDDWIAEQIAASDVDALLDYKQRAPRLHKAHPTEEHLLPLFVALGAAGQDHRHARFPVAGFEFSSISRRCVQFG